MSKSIIAINSQKLQEKLKKMYNHNIYVVLNYIYSENVNTSESLFSKL